MLPSEDFVFGLKYPAQSPGSAGQGWERDCGCSERFFFVGGKSDCPNYQGLTPAMWSPCLALPLKPFICFSKQSPKVVEAEENTEGPGGDVACQKAHGR